MSTIPKNKAIALIVAAVLIVSFLTVIFFIKSNVYTIQEYDYSFTAAEPLNVGFDVDTTMLTFGVIGVGNKGTRYINITNSYKMPLTVVAKSYGDGSEWVTPVENNFVLDSGETKQLEFNVVIPRDAELRKYEGKVRIYFNK